MPRMRGCGGCGGFNSTFSLFFSPSLHLPHGGKLHGVSSQLSCGGCGGCGGLHPRRSNSNEPNRMA